MDVEEGNLEEELVDKPRTTIGTKFSVLHCIRIPFLMRCGFRPLFRSYEYPCPSQSFPSDKTAGVFSRTFIVKTISNSLTYTLASSCVCTSPLAVMTIIGLLDVVKVSISAEFKSFLLNMRIDVLESTTNSLSSVLRVDGWCRQTPIFRRSDECHFSVDFNVRKIFGQLHRCFAGTSLLSLRLFLRPIFKIWSFGETLMRITLATHSKRWFVVSNVWMTYDGFSELNTSDWFPYVSALPKNRWRRRRLHILIYVTQLSCSDQHSRCTFCHHSFETFC